MSSSCSLDKDGVPCVRVSRNHAQHFRKHLLSLGLLDQRFCLQKDCDGTVFLPVLTSSLPLIDLQNLQGSVAPNGTCDIVWIQVNQLSRKDTGTTKHEKLVKALQELLESHGEKWTENMKEDVPHSCQRHGDLALVGENFFSLPVWRTIGQKLWPTVAKGLGAKRLAQVGKISKNGFRTPVVTMLLGDNPWVTHVDNRIRYEFDVTKCMFSAGNITEKLRIAAFDCRGETVVDLYAGIGYFTLPYLVHARASHVHACEWNPDAVAALRKNLNGNGVSDRCTIHHGDNRQLSLCDIADRVNLGLIPSSEEGWPVACRLLKRTTGGILHIHQNVTSPCHKTSVSQAGEDMAQEASSKQTDREVWRAWADETAHRIGSLLREVTGGPWKSSVQWIEHVKSYAPHVHHVVLDLECRPL